MIDYVHKNHIASLLICVDSEKAYNSIEEGFHLKFLNISTWRKNLLNGLKYFSDSSTIIENAGYLSRSFKNPRSLHQGDPIASYLYIPCSELFSIALRSQSGIKPITIHGVLNLLKQYTDHTCIKIVADSKSLNITENILHLLEHEAGLKINYDKTEILRLGSIRDRDFKLTTQKLYKWTNDTVKF